MRRSPKKHSVTRPSSRLHGAPGRGPGCGTTPCGPSAGARGHGADRLGAGPAGRSRARGRVANWPGLGGAHHGRRRRRGRGGAGARRAVLATAPLGHGGREGSPAPRQSGPSGNDRRAGARLRRVAARALAPGCEAAQRSRRGLGAARRPAADGNALGGRGRGSGGGPGRGRLRRQERVRWWAFGVGGGSALQTVALAVLRPADPERRGLGRGPGEGARAAGRQASAVAEDPAAGANCPSVITFSPQLSLCCPDPAYRAKNIARRLLSGIRSC